MFGSAAALMTFFGLLALYLNARSDARIEGTEWFPEGVVELGPSGFVFWTLILSTFTVRWAVQAIGNEDRRNAYVAMALTGLFGAAVFNQMWFILNDTGFALDGSTAELLFFVLNGTFIVFLILAVIFLALTTLRALFGQFGPRQDDGVASAALFWHVVSFMYWVTWIAVYVTK
jgi:heme/copper-type cytochrome/quinol oxidase subunit 3